MNLNIKGKLLLCFSIILLMLISTALFMVNKFYESNNRFLNMVEVSSRKVNLSSEIAIAMLEVARHEKNIIMELDQARMLYFKKRIYMAVDSVDKKTADLEIL